MYRFVTRQLSTSKDFVPKTFPCNMKSCAVSLRDPSLLLCWRLPGSKPSSAGHNIIARLLHPHKIWAHCRVLLPGEYCKSINTFTQTMIFFTFCPVQPSPAWYYRSVSTTAAV